MRKGRGKNYPVAKVKTLADWETKRQEKEEGKLLLKFAVIVIIASVLLGIAAKPKEQE